MTSYCETRILHTEHIYLLPQSNHKLVKEPKKCVKSHVRFSYSIESACDFLTAVCKYAFLEHQDTKRQKFTEGPYKGEGFFVFVSLIKMAFSTYKHKQIYQNGLARTTHITQKEKQKRDGSCQVLITFCEFLYRWQITQSVVLPR